MSRKRLTGLHPCSLGGLLLATALLGCQPLALTPVDAPTRTADQAPPIVAVDHLERPFALHQPEGTATVATVVVFYRGHW